MLWVGPKWKLALSRTFNSDILLTWIDWCLEVVLFKLILGGLLMIVSAETYDSLFKVCCNYETTWLQLIDVSNKNDSCLDNFRSLKNNTAS